MRFVAVGGFLSPSERLRLKGRGYAAARSPVQITAEAMANKSGGFVTGEYLNRSFIQ